MKFVLTLSLMFLCFWAADAQQSTPQQSPTRNDSVYLAKMNSTANLMIGGGVGLCAAGGYLIYQGISVYRTRDNSGKQSAQSQNEQNKKQGIAYLVGAGVGIAGGVVLVAIGARNKVDFKRRKKELSMDWGILDSGQLGLALSF